ncbi:MAG: Hsp70 family protein, partial [Xanthobacteraceae bacterium]
MADKTVFGIDLGTTYSCIAYVDEYGRPVVVPNAENALTTPSVVYFETATNIVVGQAAKEVARIHPDLVVQTIKREMGNPNWVRSFHGKDYRPAEIAALILKKVAGDVERTLGKTVEDVVITCPAYFGNVEKEATKQAGIIAGLNVRFVVPEPVAAALAYGINSAAAETILVYDLGGGTFDGTLLRTPGEVLATVGDHELGGRDWDEHLVRYLAQKFEDESGTPSGDLLADAQLYQELLSLAEAGKIQLSARESHTIRVRHDIEAVNVEVGRADFDRITEARLGRTIDLTRELIEEAKANSWSIDKILLVGGSTYMPQVDSRLQREFPALPRLRKDPNQIVATGAALLGFKYQVDDTIKALIDKGMSHPEAIRKTADNVGVTPARVGDINRIEIKTVTARSFGIVVRDDDDQEVVQNLVKVDDPLPAVIPRRFGTHADQQSSALIRVMENMHRETEKL